MVVVMIIAILVGIAIPAFLGARKRAQDTASKANLRNALATAQTIFTDNQAYLASATMVTQMGTEEPSLTFVDGTLAAGKSTGPKSISVNTATVTAGLDEIVLASASASGKCYFFRHLATAGAATSGTFIASTATNTACSASDGVAGLSWTAL
jgi:type II secretory pathway pseudopilin PulG